MSDSMVIQHFVWLNTFLPLNPFPKSPQPLLHAQYSEQQSFHYDVYQMIEPYSVLLKILAVARLIVPKPKYQNIIFIFVFIFLHFYRCKMFTTYFRGSSKSVSRLTNTNIQTQFTDIQITHHIFTAILAPCCRRCRINYGWLLKLLKWTTMFF